MKHSFEAPELELIRFSVEDIVTASTGNPTGGLTGSEAGDGDSNSFGNLFG